MMMTAMVVSLSVPTGCFSPYDWDKEVGVLTLNQAILDFGPPDTTADVDEGGKVLKWYVGEHRHERILHFDSKGILISGKKIGDIHR